MSRARRVAVGLLAPWLILVTGGCRAAIIPTTSDGAVYADPWLAPAREMSVEPHGAVRPNVKANGSLPDSVRARLGLGAVRVAALWIESLNEAPPFPMVQLSSATGPAFGWGRADSASHAWIDSIPPGRYLLRTFGLGVRPQIRSIVVQPGCVVSVQASLVRYDVTLNLSTGWPIPSRWQRFWQATRSKLAPTPVVAERPEPEYDGRVVVRSCEST
jgi:hypothetical protein